MEPSKPVHPKVTAATLGAAVATLAVFFYQNLTGDSVPTLVEGAIATVVAFASGYLKG